MSLVFCGPLFCSQVPQDLPTKSKYRNDKNATQDRKETSKCPENVVYENKAMATVNSENVFPSASVFPNFLNCFKNEGTGID